MRDAPKPKIFRHNIKIAQNHMEESEKWKTVTARSRGKKKTNKPKEDNKSTGESVHNDKINDSEDDIMDVSKEGTKHKITSFEKSEDEDNDSTEEVPETPIIMMYALQFVHTNQETKETYDMYAMEIQCNRSELLCVKQCFRYFNKYNDSYNFVSYKLRTEDKVLFINCIKHQNSILENTISISVFGLR